MKTPNNILCMGVLSLVMASCDQSSKIEERSNQQSMRDYPQVVNVRESVNCYNAVGFFMVGKKVMEERLPSGFVIKDAGEILGDEFKGRASLVLIYFACPVGDGTTRLTTVVAAPIEPPAFSNYTREVRWNWYEFGRLTSYQKDLDTLTAIGMATQKAELSHTPFHEGDSIASFFATVDNKLLLEVGISLTDSVNFEAQSHHLWQENKQGQLISTRWDFKYHHSWVGKFNRCYFDPAILTIVDLQGVECSAAGVTEAIETIDFKESMIVWR